MSRDVGHIDGAASWRRDRFRLAFLISGIVAVLVAAVGFLGESTVASLTDHITESFFRRKHLVVDDVKHKVESHLLRLSALTSHLANLSEQPVEEGLAESPDLSSAIGILDETNGPTAVYGAHEGEVRPLNAAARHRDPPAAPLLRTTQCAEGVCWRRLDEPDGVWLEAIALHADDDHGLSGAILVFPVAQVARRVLDGFEFEAADRLWLLAEDGTVLASLRDPQELGRNLFAQAQTCDNCHEQNGQLQDWVPHRSDHHMVLPEQRALTVYSGMSIAGERWNLCLATNHRVLSDQVTSEVWRFALMVLVVIAAVLGLAGWLVLTVRRRGEAERRAALALREAEQLRQRDEQRRFIEAVLEGTGTAIAVVGRDRRIRRYNRAFAELFRLVDAASGDREITGLFSSGAEPEDQQALARSLDRALEDGDGDRLFEYRCRFADGRAAALDLVLSPLPGPGRTEGAILAITDATERYQLAEQLAQHTQHLETLVVDRSRDLAEEKERLARIVSSIGAGLSLLDEEFSLVWTNDIVADWHGGRESILGKPCWEVFHLGGERCADCPAVRTFESGAVSQSEHVHRLSEDGAEQVVRITATPVKDRDGKVRQVLQLIQDITEQRRLEREMRHAEDLAVLGRLSAGVAHEIGNPLTSISSFIQILRERASDDFTAKSLDTVFSHIQRISQIVRQMSNLARPSEPVPKTVRLLDPARRVVEMLRRDPRFEDREIRLVEPERGEPELETDPALLEQVLLNIAINGLQATAAGGRLTLSCAPGLEETAPGERFFRIDVQDDGKGIPEEARERIFEPFYTTKAYGQGTGLGLYVSSQIMISLGGRLELDPEVTRGTRFSVLLPESLPVIHTAALAAGS